MSNIIDINSRHPYRDAEKNQSKAVQKEVQQFKENELCANLTNYFEPKPHYKEKRTPYVLSRITQHFGSVISIVIGMVLGYAIGSYCFQGFDYQITEWITLGQCLAIAAPIVCLVILEVLKVYKARSTFKSISQYGLQYVKWPDWCKLSIVFAISLAFNAVGGFQSVQVVRGDAPEALAAIVSIDSKTKDLRAITDRQTKEIEDIEKQQTERVQKGEQRMYKVDKDLIERRKVLASNEAALIAAVAKWEDHNIDAQGNTDADNQKRKAQHESSTTQYSWWFLLLFGLGDVVLILSIRYQEKWKYTAITEMQAIQNEIAKDYKEVANDGVNPVITEKKTESKPENITVEVIEENGELYAVCGELKKTKTQIKNKVASLKHRKNKQKISVELYNELWPKWWAMKVAMDDHIKSIQATG